MLNASQFTGKELHLLTMVKAFKVVLALLGTLNRIHTLSNALRVVHPDWIAPPNLRRTACQLRTRDSNNKDLCCHSLTHCTHSLSLTQYTHLAPSSPSGRHRLRVCLGFGSLPFFWSWPSFFFKSSTGMMPQVASGWFALGFCLLENWVF